jgi:hypothetical protein
MSPPDRLFENKVHKRCGDKNELGWLPSEGGKVSARGRAETHRDFFDNSRRKKIVKNLKLLTKLIKI